MIRSIVKVTIGLGSPLSPVIANIFMEHFEQNTQKEYSWAEICDSEPMFRQR